MLRSCMQIGRSFHSHLKMSAIKTAAAVALQQGYRDHLEHRAAVALAEIESRIAAFQLLPTTRLDEAATTVGLQLSATELSGLLGKAIAKRPRGAR